MAQNNTNNDVGDDIDIRELFHAISSSKRLIIVTTIIVTLVAMIYGFSRTPNPQSFTSKAVLEIGSLEYFGEIQEIRKSGLFFKCQQFW